MLPKAPSLASSRPKVHESSVVVGGDLVRVRDVAESLSRFGDRYTRRVFTAGEIDYCAQQPHLAVQRFAARFAAKEATMKALRPCATDGVAWRSIEVRKTADGWCEIVLHDAAAALARRRGIACLTLTMSHEQEYATATVVAVRSASQS